MRTYHGHEVQIISCLVYRPEKQHCKVLSQAFAGNQSRRCLRQCFCIKAWDGRKLDGFCFLLK